MSEGEGGEKKRGGRKTETESRVEQTAKVPSEGGRWYGLVHLARFPPTGENSFVFVQHGIKREASVDDTGGNGHCLGNTSSYARRILVYIRAHTHGAYS